MMRKPIYIEYEIDCPPDKAWSYIQQPKLHAQWDFRFSQIVSEKQLKDDSLHTFHYTKKIIPGVTLSGMEERKTVEDKASGIKTTSLHVKNEQPFSFIKEGRSYTQLIPRDKGITLISELDYNVRFGFIGRLLDTIFRPFISWTTALSINVLTRWLETGERPQLQYRRFLSYYVMTFIFMFVWFYQGLVPKVIGQHPLEIEMLTKLSPLSATQATDAIVWIGFMEIVIALLFFVKRWHKTLWTAHIILFPFLTASAIFAASHTATDPFNVVTLNGTLWLLSITARLLVGDLPSGSAFVRKKIPSSS